MKSCLLLLVSLMTGCAASSEVKGCKEGWVEFTCMYPNQSENYEKIEVEIDNPEQKISNSKKNEWITKDRVSLYHDTNNKTLKVAIRQLQSQDSGEYECKFYQHATSSEEAGERDVAVKIETGGCNGPFVQTAYRTAKTTIICDYPGHEYQYKFLCKDNSFTCEDILSNKSSPNSNGTLTLTQSNSVFMSISDVSPHDAGVYWCGVEPRGEIYRAGLKKIQLEVQSINTFTRSPTIGQDFTYWCEYPNGTPIKKFICKGEDPSICEPLTSTQNNMNTRFSMKDKKEKRNITITVREITADDTGTYWCGADRTENTHSNPFFHRFLMTVVPPTTSTPSNISTTSSSSSLAGGPWLTVIIAAAICVALLVLVVILVLVHKRFQRSKNINKEDRPYDEIQECPQKPDSGTALKTIYATANLPTKPSPASDQYSYIDFKNNSDEVSHTYSTVKDPHPTYSTVNHPSRLPEDPFYSTVNNPQQH